MHSVYLLLFVVTSGVTSQRLLQINEEWHLFKLKNNRTYFSKEEENHRYAVFSQNAKQIFRHNMAADKGHYSYWLKINIFADMTDEEFARQFTGLNIKVKPEKLKINRQWSNSLNLSLPGYIDWREKNCVTKVKHQGVCGSCYAFAATGALESHHCIKTGKLVSLSEQNIIDCTDNNLYWNQGCIGGQAENAFQYVIDNGGVDTEKAYPYTSEVGDCHFKRDAVGATAEDYIDLPVQEAVLQGVVAGLGPVAICLDTSGLTFYSHGVFDGRYEQKGTLHTCSRIDVNHAMLVVGYGTTRDGKNYWLIKNSWGEGWGLDGYLLLIRNYKNTCGVVTLASYPIV